MMRPFFSLIAALAGTLLMAGCDVISPNVKGEGPVVEYDKTPARTFTKVLISVPGKVYIAEGSETKVTLIAQENVEEVMRTDLNGDDNTGYTLEIAANKTIKRFDSLAIYITVPDLINISINSDAELLGTTDWSFPALTMTLNGSGTLTIPRLTGDVLALDLPGSGSIVFRNGGVSELTIQASGNASADLAELRAQDVAVTQSGSGTIRVNAVQKLDVTINGGGIVEYRGTPFVTQSITGSGILRKI